MEPFPVPQASPKTPKLRKSATALQGWGHDVPSAEKVTPKEAAKLRADFVHLLIHKHHHIIAAWVALDTKLKGRLSFYEYCRAARELGYTGSTRRLWEALDHERQGFISLYEIDPNTARLLENFAIVVWGACGSVQAAWEKHFNRRGLGRCVPESFEAGCSEIGFTGDVKAVYDALNYDQCITSIGFINFDVLKMWFAVKRSPDKVSMFHPHIDQETAEHRARVAAAAKPQAAKRVAGARELTEKDKFKRLLLKSYGNLVRAWRDGLDRDRNGRLDYQEFKIACADVGYPGIRKKLWDELDVNGSGEVSLGELDEHTATLLEGFYSCVMERYFTWEEAWSRHFDHKGLDRVEIQDFRDGCLTLGYGGNVDRLFDLLDTDRLKYLSYSSCSWIAGGEEPDQSPLWEEAGDFKITGQFKKLTKSQLRKMDQNARDDRVRQRRFEARNRGEIEPLSPKSNGTLSRSLTATMDLSEKGPAFGCSAWNLAARDPESPHYGDGILSDSSPDQHRFAHSAALYYTRDAYPPPPRAQAPAAPSSPFRARLNGRGERVLWRPKGDSLSNSLPSLGLSRSAASEPSLSASDVYMRGGAAVQGDGAAAGAVGSR